MNICTYTFFPFFSLLVISFFLLLPPTPTGSKKHTKFIQGYTAEARWQDGAGVCVPGGKL